MFLQSFPCPMRLFTDWTPELVILRDMHSLMLLQIALVRECSVTGGTREDSNFLRASLQYASISIHEMNLQVLVKPTLLGKAPSAFGAQIRFAGSMD